MPPHSPRANQVAWSMLLLRCPDEGISRRGRLRRRPTRLGVELFLVDANVLSEASTKLRAARPRLLVDSGSPSERPAPRPGVTASSSPAAPFRYPVPLGGRRASDCQQWFRRGRRGGSHRLPWEAATGTARAALGRGACRPEGSRDAGVKAQLIAAATVRRTRAAGAATRQPAPRFRARGLLAAGESQASQKRLPTDPHDRADAR